MSLSVVTGTYYTTRTQTIGSLSKDGKESKTLVPPTGTSYVKGPRPQSTKGRPSVPTSAVSLVYKDEEERGTYRTDGKGPDLGETPKSMEIVLSVRFQDRKQPLESGSHTIAVNVKQGGKIHIIVEGR